jgi:hypothetical protein
MIRAEKTILFKSVLLLGEDINPTKKSKSEMELMPDFNQDRTGEEINIISMMCDEVK